MGYIGAYINDGSGRDTFINRAGAYWLNPVPPGASIRKTHDPNAATVASAMGTTLGNGSYHEFATGANLGGSRYAAGSSGKAAFDTQQLENDKLVPLDHTSPTLLQGVGEGGEQVASCLVRGPGDDKLPSGTLQMDHKTLESTMHYSYRTGLYPVPSQAPPPMKEFAPKGSLTKVVW